MARYEKYKDSGVYYLQEIPSSWEVHKAKWLFNEEKRAIRNEDEIVTCFRDGQVTLRKNRRTEGFTNAVQENGYQGIRKGDLVIHNMDAFAGAIGVSDSDGKSTPVYAVCTPKRDGINPYFYSYFLRNLAYSGFILSLAKGIRERSTDFRFADFRELSLPVPPVEEQNAIVSYIDDVYCEIDKAIAQQQRMIVLLNERKQIIIQNAVTKGLDPNVPMKDSGVDYIGQIPASWELKKIKYLASYNDEALPETTKKDTEIEYVEIGNVSFGQGITNSTKYLFGDAPSRARRITKKGDIIISTVRTYLKAVAVIDKDDLIVSTGFMVIRPNTRMIDGRFMSYAVLASSLINEIEKISVGTSYPAVNAWQVADLKIAYPNSKEEQERIADYLFKVESYVEIAINRHKMAIDVLQERKRIIINDVVTGKIKVL